MRHQIQFTPLFEEKVRRLQGPFHGPSLTLVTELVIALNNNPWIVGSDITSRHVLVMLDPGETLRQVMRRDARARIPAHQQTSLVIFFTRPSVPLQPPALNELYLVDLQRVDLVRGARVSLT